MSHIQDREALKFLGQQIPTDYGRAALFWPFTELCLFGSYLLEIVYIQTFNFQIFCFFVLQQNI